MFCLFDFSPDDNLKVEHYRVRIVKGKLTVDEEEFFDNLIELVKVSYDSLSLYENTGCM